MTVSSGWRRAIFSVLALVALAPAPKGWAQMVASAPPEQGNSALDALLFYQLLIGELELRGGQPGNAFQVILDAARRTRDEALFRRAVDIALQARAGEQGLSAVRAWRLARPDSVDALRMQLQILLAMNRPDDMNEPLRALLAQTPAAQRANLIASLPQFLQRSGDRQRMAVLVEDSLKLYADAPATRLAVLVARARVWLLAGEVDRALQLTRQAHEQAPTAIEPGLIALALMGKKPEAEALVTRLLTPAEALPDLRLAYVRVLTGAQRYGEALAQLEIATRQRPNDAGPYLSLGALHLELKRPKEAEQALRRHLELLNPTATPTPLAAKPATDALAEDEGAAQERRPVQAWLMLAQAAEQQGNLKAAENWLAQIGDVQHALDVQTRRASLLARQGQMPKARELIRKTPERSADDKRAKLVAEAGLLRDFKLWPEALEVLRDANQQLPDDGDLLYTQAMVAEKLARLDEMERLLRRVISLNPDNAHAYNALGYALADRGQRLPEARSLIQRALEISPGDPFITDSLAWVEFRLGNREEALRLLRQAYSARPDTEIGVHLGEVLWSLGRHDEARRIWREVRGRDASNEVLLETLARLRITL